MHSIQTLLDLHEQILDQEDGYWIKLEAWQVEMTESIPHGIRYALTLHNPSGLRILGYDNAHQVKVKGKKYSGRRMSLIISIVMRVMLVFLTYSKMPTSC